MPDNTTILSLPLILPAQAQKHVTHNEALRLLDVAVQLAVKNRTLNAAPSLPAIGDRHIVDTPASGDWAGHGDEIAVFTETGWEFVQPLAGWRAHVLAEGQTAVYTGSGWELPSEGVLTPDMVGVNATANATNRLVVSSPATLLTHEGGGHQVKINKASNGDTASLLFQTGYAGRAEMGLAGNNDFSVKVSPDGNAWQEVLVVDATSGIASLPMGAQIAQGTSALPGLGFVGDANTGIFSVGANQMGFATGGALRATVSNSTLELNVPVSGAAAVQSVSSDLLPDLGLLVPTSMSTSLIYKGRILSGQNLDNYFEPGIYRIHNASDALGILNVPASNSGATLEVLGHDAAQARGAFALVVQRFTLRNSSAGHPREWVRQNNSSSAAVWSPWTEVYTQASVLGAVAQAGGRPTGALIERGSSANGDYVRLADGTQICWRRDLAATNAATAAGSLFRSANVAWTFPAAFAGVPVVNGGQSSVVATWVAPQTPTVTSVNLTVMAATTQAAAITFGAKATGRWF